MYRLFNRIECGVRTSALHRLVCLAVIVFAAWMHGDARAVDTSVQVGAEAGGTASGQHPWPHVPRPSADAPNIVVVLLDDVGFAATDVFGGAIKTPELGRLAQEGLRYNRFHTAALCSPTRAALLSGRNPHQVGAGVTPESASSAPGYNNIWNPSAAPFVKVLQKNGYATAGFGKWHNTPIYETGPTGPFQRWPTSLGFDHFYGFHGGETSQWKPRLFRNTLYVDPPETPEYHFTTDIVDEAIRWVKREDSLNGERPWFLYMAPGAAHSPHHVPEQWIKPYKGRFDAGWDALRKEIFARQKKMGVIPADARLTPRPPELPAWDSLSADEKRVVARQMEVYAGFLAHTDHELGRLFDTLRRSPEWDNTLVLYIVGDNGGSAEANYIGKVLGLFDMQYELAHIDELGGPLRSNNYAAPWAWATDTPFQWTKQIAAYFGGTRNPLVVTWPRRIQDRGGLRSQFTYLTDIAPTILHAAGIAMPETVDGVKQLPLEGFDLTDTFTNAQAPERRRTQYFELRGNRALYKDGWMASVRHSVPWDFSTRGNPDDDRWELYHIDQDFSQARDLAAQHPDKLKELKAEFDREAVRNRVYPLIGGIRTARAGSGRPSPSDGLSSFVFYPDSPRMPEPTLPILDGRTYRLEADVRLPAAAANGVIVAAGDNRAGFTWFVKDGRVIYESLHRGERWSLASDKSLPVGQSVKLGLEVVQENEAGGVVRLLTDGKVSSEARFTRLSGIPSNQWLEIGRQMSTPVSTAYTSPFKFSGEIREVRLQLK